MAKVKVKLKHFSYLPGAVGGPGTVVSVDEETAARWLSDGGAEAMDEKPAPKKKRTLSKRDIADEKAEAIKADEEKRQSRDGE